MVSPWQHAAFAWHCLLMGTWAITTISKAHLIKMKEYLPAITAATLTGVHWTLTSPLPKTDPRRPALVVSPFFSTLLQQFNCAFPQVWAACWMVTSPMTFPLLLAEFPAF